MAKIHKPTKFILVILTNLLLLELLSVFFVYMIGLIRPNQRLDLMLENTFATVDEEYLHKFISLGYDELLGWDNEPGSEQTFLNVAGDKWSQSYGTDGAREDGHNGGSLLIAAYGDSATNGHEVNNDQTWPFFLELIIGGEVKNFGVGAYGVDQAFLKLKRHLEQGVIAPITMLVIYEDDLNRAVNSFRPFYNHSTGVKLGFKPHYRYLDGEVKIISNPFSNPSLSLQELKGLAFRLAPFDFWMSKRLLIYTDFPYMLQTTRTIQHVVRKAKDALTGSNVSDLWDSTEGRAIMGHIINDYLHVTEMAESIPVIMFIPSIKNWEDGRTVPGYQNFKEEVLAREFREVTVIDVYEAEFDEAKFSILPFRGHPNAYGNTVIAEHVANRIAEKIMRVNN